MYCNVDLASYEMTGSNALALLRDVDAYLFDVFGTTLDWYNTIKRQVIQKSNGALDKDQDGVEFAQEWRQGYYKHIANISAGGQGSLNVDVVHRQILDRMLQSARWSHLATVWDDAARAELVYAWHDLDAYEDTVPGLTELRESGLVVALSNGNYRLLVDLARNKQLPWHGILSAEFFGVYKPMTKVYLSASYHLSIPPERIAMVAAHQWDLTGAKQAGLKTVYVPRPAEDSEEIRKNMRSKEEGGSVDLVVKDFKELARLAAEAKKSEVRNTP